MKNLKTAGKSTSRTVKTNRPVTHARDRHDLPPVVTMETCIPIGQFEMTQAHFRAIWNTLTETSNCATPTWAVQNKRRLWNDDLEQVLFCAQ